MLVFLGNPHPLRADYQSSLHDQKSSVGDLAMVPFSSHQWHSRGDQRPDLSGEKESPWIPEHPESHHDGLPHCRKVRLGHPFQVAKRQSSACRLRNKSMGILLLRSVSRIAVLSQHDKTCLVGARPR